MKMNNNKTTQNNQLYILKGRKVYLRAIEMDDLACLYEVENDETLWPFSNATSPFSKDFLTQYLAASSSNIYVDLQLRLMICRVEDQAVVGIIDLFDFVPKYRRAQVGIMVRKRYRELGYAKEALLCLIRYTRHVVRMRQLYAEVPVNNVASLSLFKSCGFTQAGLLKDWVINEGTYVDAEFLQLINEKIGL